MANTTYRVKLVRADFQLEVDGDRKFVLEMLARFDKLAAAISDKTTGMPRKEPSADGALAAAEQKGISPGEFIRQLPFKKHTDVVLAFGYYLEKHSGLKAFSAADVNNCYYEAKMERSNTSQMIVQNIRRGYLMQAKAKGEEKQGGRKLFTLTRTGEEYLQQASKGSSAE